MREISRDINLHEHAFWLSARSTAACAAPFLAKREGRGKFVRAECRNYHSGKLVCEKLLRFIYFTVVNHLYDASSDNQHHISALKQLMRQFFIF